ncbi:hypothetical protein HZH66_000561 [Vespula vulgaris]|uniref:Uncharacterized protein n=1 Tax=Vespula vulgaris TaxID=7454 RepID=A0A834NJV6_VESVU|nr:hypothetical protein HZH66_000561 [Vespula vulgaris]
MDPLAQTGSTRPSRKLCTTQPPNPGSPRHHHHQHHRYLHTTQPTSPISIIREDKNAAITSKQTLTDQRSSTSRLCWITSF